MAYFRAVVKRTVSELFVVEADTPGQARTLIDDENDQAVLIAETEEDGEIYPGSLQEASSDEVKRYKRELSRMGG